MIMPSKIFQYKFSIILCIAVLFLSLMNSSDVPGTKLWNFEGLDKIVHILMYISLTSTIFLEKNKKSQEVSKNILSKNNLIPLILLVLMGGSIELIQPIVANRSCEITDFLANISGIILGFFLHFPIPNILER